MKRSLLFPCILALVAVLPSACASLEAGRANAAAATAPGTDATLWGRLAGTWDNHAQVWAAAQDGQGAVLEHLRQEIRRTDTRAPAWDWTLERVSGTGPETLSGHWRYTLACRSEADCTLLPARPLADAAGDASEWARMVPCALHGGLREGRLQLQANEAACGAMLTGLGAAAVLLPLRVGFDGEVLTVQTWSDLARGARAQQEARQVHWYSGWAAISGAGPEARADDADWHTTRTLHVGDQGRAVPIPWRDGTDSSWQLRLETLDYRQRGVRLLRLSLLREDGESLAYAWADPGARNIGINLGWLQVGLERDAAP